MDAVDKDYLPWLAIRQCAISIHEIDLVYFNFKSGPTNGPPTHLSFVLNNLNVLFANLASQEEAWRYNSTLDRVQHGAIAA